jgi:hypothetical protein
MYVQITKTLLETRPKKHLLQMFRVSPETAKLKKNELVKEILRTNSPTHKSVTLFPYLLICEYCGTSFIMSGSATPLYCMKCGRTSPYLAFERNLQRTQLLLETASKLTGPKDSNSRSILLEQALVTIITSLEVVLRDVYALVIDHKHVIFGESIYPRVYRTTRNEFLGLGSAAAKIKKDLGLNLKHKLGTSNYSFLSRMYSARHIIVHNCSIKDTDYLAQTGEPIGNLNSTLSVTRGDLIRLTSIAKAVARLGETQLRACILNHHRRQTNLMVTISDKGPLSTKRSSKKGAGDLTIRRSRMLV